MDSVRQRVRGDVGGVLAGRDGYLHHHHGPTTIHANVVEGAFHCDACLRPPPAPTMHELETRLSDLRADHRTLRRILFRHWSVFTVLALGLLAGIALAVAALHFTREHSGVIVALSLLMMASTEYMVSCRRPLVRSIQLLKCEATEVEARLAIERARMLRRAAGESIGPASEPRA